MADTTERYFKLSQEELEKENQRIMQAIQALQEEQAVLSRALDLAVQTGYARAQVAEMSDVQRIAFLRALQGN